MVTHPRPSSLPSRLAVRPTPPAADPLAQLLRDIELELAGMEEGDGGADAEGLPGEGAAAAGERWGEAELAADLAAGGRGRIRIRGAHR